MKIQNISSILYTPKKYDAKNYVSNPKINSSYSYNGYFYKDFNVSFAGLDKDFRKHWSPEEFYSLKSNQKYMPDTMREYLFEDINTRFHQSPIRVMSEAFQQIEEAKDLDDVKQIFPKEKLFVNLTSIPNKTSRKGVLAEHRVFGDYGPLFADGSDDLGMYILKKIYLEGKQLSEINKDFQKDISDVYKGALSSITDADIYAYGIKRPERPFWHSLTHNREDFPYEYRPKNIKPVVYKDIVAVSVKHTKFNNRQLHSISDYMLDLWKDLPPAESNKKLKRLKLGDEGEGFYKMFRSPIGIIAADKVGLAQKLSTFMVNGFIPANLKNIVEQLEKEDVVVFDLENPNDKLKALMRFFWNRNPKLKVEFGDAIRQTIEEFEKAYEKGEDSKELLDLLKRADELKTKKAVRMSEYARLRRENLKKDIVNTTPVIQPSEDKSVLNVVEKSVQEQPLSLRDLFTKNIMEFGDVLPSKFLDTYTNFLLNSPLINEDFMAKFVDGNSEALEKTFEQINEDLSIKHLSKIQAAQQAVVDVLRMKNNNNLSELYQLDLNEIVDFTTNSGIDFTQENKALVNRLYQEYLKPVSPKDSANILSTVMKQIKYFGEENVNSKIMGGFVALLAKNVQENNGAALSLEKLIKKSNFIDDYGSSAKILMDDNISLTEKLAKFENFMLKFILKNFNNDKLSKLLTMNKNNTRDILAFRFPELYNLIKNLEIHIK